MHLEHEKQKNNILDDELESVMVDDNFSYIKEVPEELEGTTRMTGTKLSVLHLPQ